MMDITVELPGLELVFPFNANIFMGWVEGGLATGEVINSGGKSRYVFVPYEGTGFVMWRLFRGSFQPVYGCSVYDAGKVGNQNWYLVCARKDFFAYFYDDGIGEMKLHVYEHGVEIDSADGLEKLRMRGAEPSLRSDDL